MATKPLKTITFEGLEDTYTIPQIDDTLSVTGASADAKVTGDSLKAKADIEGAVSMAKALVGGKYTLDQSPYHYRKSPDAGSVDEKIVGGTLGWNQLCNSSSVTVQTGHKYLSKIGGTYSVGSSTGTAITGLTSGTDMVFDLTTLFDSTIADYIYSLETATAGAGVAWVKRYIDLDTYHEYCEPTLKSVEGLQSRDVVGFNQWDEEWEEGDFDIQGNPIAGSGRLRSKNYIAILPNAEYYIKLDYPIWFTYVLYDKDKNFLTSDAFSMKREHILTTPTNARYMKFRTESNKYPLPYNHDICINLSDPSKNGTYEPYEKHSYPLDSSIELMGIPKLSDGKMYFDGDEYQSDGQVVRRYGERAYQSGDESLANAITDGTTTVYKLTTPTTETAQPYQSPQLAGATEEYVTTGVVPVGHESRYYEDITGKVNNLPSDFSTLIAPVEKSFTATRNYTVGSFVIVNNQLYKVTSAISSGGTIKPNSNVTATTIMAEILALA